jgi:hypothetical protein
MKRAKLEKMFVEVLLELPAEIGDAMPKFRIECYNASSGVVISFSWDDEDEYLRIKAFLHELVGGPAVQVKLHPDRPDSYYFENDQQRDAFYTFLRTLKKREA